MIDRILAATMVFGIAAAGQPAQAWSVHSHMTTGAIAYDDLASRRPDILAKAEQLIQAHPDHARFAEEAKGMNEPERTRVAFEWLARWADDVRGTEADRPDWHYELRVVHGWTWLWPFRNGNALAGFAENFQTLSDTKMAPADRAIALGWLMHIVGDMQQPLHAGHMLTANFWATDEAGTISYMRRTETDSPRELHELWDQALDVEDDLMITSEKWAGLLQRSLPRTSIQEVSLYAGTPQEKFRKWVHESEYLAGIVYRDFGHKAAAVKDDAPPLTSAQLRFVEALSKRRIATSGYRIADILRMALE